MKQSLTQLVEQGKSYEEAVDAINQTGDEEYSRRKDADMERELLEVLAEMVVRFQNLRESNGLDRKSNLAKRAYELIAKAAEIAALKGGA